MLPVDDEQAQVLELADKQDLGSCASGREGSTPSLGTIFESQSKK